MSILEEIRENLTAQLHELEALESVYPKELVISDHGTLADINSFIERPNKELPPRLEYSIEISMEEGSIELFMSLPSNYPAERPEAYARSSLLDRTQQCLLNEALTALADNQEEEVPCIYTLVSWVQDNAEKYVSASKVNQEKKSDGRNKKDDHKDHRVFARYWIYSHHIYSKFKRRHIANLMKENSLTGFCLAGKPGIICMEGIQDDCEYCWQQIKVMNWHRILVKFIEEDNVPDDSDIDKMRKFTEFQEISFPSSERHNDMGQLLKFLIKHDSQHAFKELFGIEGKFAQPAS